MVAADAAAAVVATIIYIDLRNTFFHAWPCLDHSFLSSLFLVIQVQLVKLAVLLSLKNERGCMCSLVNSSSLTFFLVITATVVHRWAGVGTLGIYS